MKPTGKRSYDGVKKHKFGFLRSHALFELSLRELWKFWQGGRWGNNHGHVESQERRSGPNIIVNNLCFPSIASLSTLLLFPLKL